MRIIDSTSSGRWSLPGLLLAIVIFWAGGGWSGKAQDSNGSAAWKEKLRSEFEIGGAFVDIQGSQQKYRSDVNIRPGAHLQSFYLSLPPGKAAAGWYSTATFQGQGFGDVDPYENFRINLRQDREGKRKYDFRFAYSKDNYYFSVPGFALGLHSDDNIRRSLNFSLDYHPFLTSRYHLDTLKLRLGYGQIKRYGNSFSSDTQFQDVFRLLVFNRSQTDDYRVGLEWQSSTPAHPSRFGYLGLSFDQTFRSFRYDNQLTNVTPAETGLNSPGNVVLNSYRQDLPTRGFLPVSMLALKYRPKSHSKSNPNELSRNEFVARYEYSKGNIDFTRSDLMSLRIGTANAALEKLALTQAVSDQPQHRLDTATSLYFWGDRIGFHNNFNFNRYNIYSDALTDEIFRNPATQSGITFSSSASTFTRYTRFANDAFLEYERGHLSARTGYRYSVRAMDFLEQNDEIDKSHNSTLMHSVYTALTYVSDRKEKPWVWRGSIEYEHGWANAALLRIEPLKFNRWSSKGSLRLAGGLRVSGSVGIRKDENNTVGTQHSFDNHDYALQLQWLPNRDYLFEAGWGRMDILSVADIYYFLLTPQAGVSRYETNTNFGNFFAQVPLCHSPGVRAQMGYKLMDDSGGSFPLVFHQGDAGLAIDLPTFNGWDMLRSSLNLGWKYYSYNEKNASLQDYSGHLLFVSMRFGF